MTSAISTPPPSWMPCLDMRCVSYALLVRLSPFSILNRFAYLPLIVILAQAEQAAALEARLDSLVKDNLIKPRGGVLVKGKGASSGGGAAEDITQRMQRKVQGRAPPKRGGSKKKKK